MNTRLVFVLLSVVFSLVQMSDVRAEEKQKLTVERVLQLEYVDSVDVAPKGDMVLYGLRVPAPLDGSATSGYTIYNVFYGSYTIQVSEKDDGISSMKWHPKGEYLTYLKDGQLHLLTPDAKWHSQATDLDVSISSNYKYAPTGNKVAWTSLRPWTDEEQAEREMGKDFDVVEENYRHYQLHIYDFDLQRHYIATPDEYSVWAFDWDRYGQKVVFTATEENITDANYMLKKIYVMDVSRGERTLLVDTEGKLTAPHWSADGENIAWAGGVDKTDPYQGSLFLYSMESPEFGASSADLIGNLKNMTGDYIGTVKDLRWGADGMLLVRYAEFEEENLYAIDPESGEMRLVAGEELVISSFDSGGETVAFTASTAMHPNELFVGMNGREIRRITHYSRDLENYRLGRQVVYKWTAGDGTPLQGVLIYPVDYQEGVRYPLIVQPHGGPESNYSNGWNTSYSRWSQLLANEGYFVFAPNYRASTGRGVAFAKADHHDLGGAEFQDVIDGVKALVKDGLVDENRVGSGGGSYGGYFSALAATKGSEHFAAAVVFAGITNWISFQGTSDIPVENAWVHWNEPEWYYKQDLMMQASPVHYIDRAQTPTLIAHGEKDLRVPLGQGQELFRMLKLKGVPTQLVVYPRAGHGLGEVQHQLDYATRVINWFNKYVRDKE